VLRPLATVDGAWSDRASMKSRRASMRLAARAQLNAQPLFCRRSLCSRATAASGSGRAQGAAPCAPRRASTGGERERLWWGAARARVPSAQLKRTGRHA
jgi:hypothetical protein